MEVSSGTKRAPGQTESDTALRTGRERGNEVVRAVVPVLVRTVLASFLDRGR
ncbi:hypothetical protein [Streptomyces sp. NPDC048560]|uniref:hypothetical protein n=1 Tax=Streptomyces sp. NPDC048560 TaxID=3155488 RepID=UPI00343DF08F